MSWMRALPRRPPTLELLMPDDIPFYPDLLCWEAPLRPNEAPVDDCPCRVCSWVRLSSAESPIKPSDPAWGALLEVSQR